MVMDTGTEHEIRQRLAWQRPSEVLDYLKDARRARLAKYELDRRGIEIWGVMEMSNLSVPTSFFLTKPAKPPHQSHGVAC